MDKKQSNNEETMEANMAINRFLNDDHAEETDTLPVSAEFAAARTILDNDNGAMSALYNEGIDRKEN